VNAATARRAILWQHEQLRALLVRAHAVAESALDGDTLAPGAVASAVGDIRSTMEIHLTFEESVLLPLLRDDLPAGPPRAERLVDEHRRQRALLAAIHAEACAHPELPMLATKLSFLTTWLLSDMAEEESCLLAEDIGGEDVWVIEQTRG
jgi:hypothetical protein